MVVILLFELFQGRSCAKADAADSDTEMTGGRARLLRRGFSRVISLNHLMLDSTEARRLWLYQLSP